MPVPLNNLRPGFGGTVLQQGDAGYNEAREIWNAMIDRKPALMIQCSGVADVIQAIKFAAAHDLLTAIRGGGHNIGGSALAEGGVVIDLSNMKSVHVDPQARRAYVSRARLWAMLIMKLRPLVWQFPWESTRQPALPA